jgi:hypothetical protein
VKKTVDAPKGFFRFAVHVHPGSRTASVGGSHNGALKVHVVARAVDNLATNEVLAILASAFNVRPGEVSCLRGAKSREKSIAIEGDLAILPHILENLLALP